MIGIECMLCRKHQNRIAVAAGCHHLVTRYRHLHQYIGVKRIVCIPIQRIYPIFGVGHVRRMTDTIGYAAQWLTDIRQPLLLGLQLFSRHQTRQHIHQPVWQQGPAWQCITGKNGDVCYRFAQLQQRLTAAQVLHPCLALLKPGLISLKIQTHPIEGHARLFVHPRIVCKHMKHQFINTQCKLPVAKGFQLTGMFCPIHANRCKRFGLHYVFSIHVCCTNGITHVVGFIMRRTVVPKFTHGQIGVLKMR